MRYEKYWISSQAVCQLIYWLLTEKMLFLQFQNFLCFDNDKQSSAVDNCFNFNYSLNNYWFFKNIFYYRYQIVTEWEWNALFPLITCVHCVYMERDCHIFQRITVYIEICFIWNITKAGS